MVTLSSPSGHRDIPMAKAVSGRVCVRIRRSKRIVKVKYAAKRHANTGRPGRLAAGIFL